MKGVIVKETEEEEEESSGQGLHGSGLGHNHAGVARDHDGWVVESIAGGRGFGVNRESERESECGACERKKMVRWH